ncbi:MAG: M23 family metallopeptidase [Candidatus Nanopelagicales bacterium]
MMRLRWTVLGLCLLVSAAVLAGGRADAGDLWPVPGGLQRDFDPPDPDWLPGHRGVDLAAHAGDPVVSPRAGRVGFVGRVAGTPVLTIDHGMLRATYQPVTSSLTAGTPVAAGQVVATVATGGHCSGQCLHWGALMNDRYVDPRLLLGHTRVVLRPL